MQASTCRPFTLTRIQRADRMDDQATLRFASVASLLSHLFLAPGMHRLPRCSLCREGGPADCRIHTCRGCDRSQTQRSTRVNLMMLSDFTEHGFQSFFFSFLSLRRVKNTVKNTCFERFQRRSFSPPTRGLSTGGRCSAPIP